MSTQYNGTTEYSKIANVYRLNTAAAATWSFYVNFVALTGTQVISKSNAGAAPFLIEVQASAAGVLTVVFDNAGAVGTATTGAGAVTTGVNYHLAVVFNGVGTTNDEKWKLYKNGVDQGALTFGGAAPIGVLPSTAGQPLYLAVRNAASGFYPCYLQEVRIWDTALTAQDILNDIASSVPTYPKRLISWVPLTGNTDTRQWTPLDSTVTHSTATADGADITTKTIHQAPSSIMQRPSYRWRTRRDFANQKVKFYPVMNRGM